MAEGAAAAVVVAVTIGVVEVGEAGAEARPAHHGARRQKRGRRRDHRSAARFAWTRSRRPTALRLSVTIRSTATALPSELGLG